MRGYAATLPVAFSAGIVANIRANARAAASYSLEMSTALQYNSVESQYIKFVRAMGVQLTFSAQVIMQFMYDWLAQGFAARTIPGRLSALRRFARRMRMPFPEQDSDEWHDIQDMQRALLKIDPTVAKQATVVDLSWIMRVAAASGITSLQSLLRCHPLVLQQHARALLVHACCMRGCEHRSGMRMMDVQAVTPQFVQVKVASRYSEKKLKLRPGRLCVMPRSPDAWSAGEVMLVYMWRLRHHVHPASYLFPLITGAGVVDESKPATAGMFIKEFVRRLRYSGMTVAKCKRVSNHSFRAGGATDWSASGMSDTFIAQQGGWTTDCFRRYIRPTRLHRLTQAARALRASHILLQSMSMPTHTF